MNREQQQKDRQYLRAAIEWLRLVLARRIEPRCWCSRLWSRRDRAMERREAALAEAQAGAPEPSLVQLCRVLGLNAFQQQTLLLCIAAEVDRDIEAKCAVLRGDGSQPTFALAFALFGTSWEALSPESPLRRFKLIEINQPGATALTSAALRADEHVVNYSNGIHYLDDRLTPLMRRIPFEASVPLAPSQEKKAVEIISALDAGAAAAAHRWPVVQLIGPESSGKQMLAARVAAQYGYKLFRLGADLIPPQVAETEALARLWEREQRLLGLALYMDADELEAENAWAAVERFAGRGPGRMFVASRDSRRLGTTPAAIFEIGKVPVAEQRGIWRDGLRYWVSRLQAEAVVAAQSDSPQDQQDAGRWERGAREVRIASRLCATPLANSFSLPTGEILNIQHDSVMRYLLERGATRLHELLWEACRVHTRPQLDTLATRVEVKADKKHLVLPRPQCETIARITEQVRHRWRVYENWKFEKRMNRGLGISVLFAGDSGTGKTMAAEVIASELHLDLYRIDLSGVVSKFIGETEKNLRRVFDAAENGGAILFFDEADSLFGCRSEIKDSHDRYANIEVNYLLQRMESYRGLAILATNRKSALDPAFLRRLRFVVDFPFPSPAERRAIWQGAFPQHQPHLDYARLAKLNLTGGSIHNVALAAAFIAEAKGQATVTMPIVMEAARQELRKLERPFNENDLKVHEDAPVGEKVPA